jgi:hypothetical protein
MGVDKTALGVCAGLFVGLSQLTQKGVLQPGILSNVAIFFYALLSVQEILMPLPTLTAFGFEAPSPLTKALLALQRLLGRQGARVARGSPARSVAPGRVRSATPIYLEPRHAAVADSEVCCAVRVQFQIGAFVLVSKLTGKIGLGLVASIAHGGRCVDLRQNALQRRDRHRQGGPHRVDRRADHHRGAGLLDA